MPPIDLGGAIIIGSACSLLIVRIVAACKKVRAVKEARWRAAIQPQSKTQGSLLANVPPRLFYGLLFGALASSWPMVSFALDLSATSLGPLDGIAGAFGTASKWMLIAAVLSWIRAQGLVRIRAAMNR